MPRAPGRFLFPSGICPFTCGSGRKRWLVADGGHHQVVLLDDTGDEIARFGSGQAGLADGPAAQARFHYPQGITATCDAVYVADTLNHALRRIDLVDMAVDTLVAQEHAPALCLPFDLLRLANGTILFSNAGTRQLAAWTPEQGVVPLAHGLHWPTRMAFLEKGLYFMDDGSVRFLKEVSMGGIVGMAAHPLHRPDTHERGSPLAPPAMKVSGDFHGRSVITRKDPGQHGRADPARLQPPFPGPWGLAVGGGKLWFAGHGHAPLGVMDLCGGSVNALEEGKCLDPHPLPLGEIAGIVYDHPERVLVTDRNQHRIVEFAPSSGRFRTFSA